MGQVGGTGGGTGPPAFWKSLEMLKRTETVLTAMIESRNRFGRGSTETVLVEGQPKPFWWGVNRNRFGRGAPETVLVKGAHEGITGRSGHFSARSAI